MKMGEIDQVKQEEEKLERLRAIVQAKSETERKVQRRRASVFLGRSLKTIDRYVKSLEGGNTNIFVHGNKGHIPKNKIADEVKKDVIDLYCSSFKDASFAHFSEILREDKGIFVSDTTLHRWLKPIFISSPKSKKSTKRRLRTELEASLKEKEVPVEIEVNKLIELDRLEAHPMRPRSKYFGEMIQMDASEFKWNGSVKWHLHLAIDDATSHIVGAWFDTEETLNGYYHVLEQILVNYGIPAMFYTDKRTVFEYNRKDSKGQREEEDTFTQFSRACDSLGIEIKTTSVAQAKGRIERANSTFQMRLPIDLRRKGITNMRDANEYLVKEYLNQINSRFSSLSESDKQNSVFLNSPSSETINHTLAIITERTINDGHSIKYKNKYYLPVDKNGNKKFFRNRTKTLVIEAYDKSLFVNVNDVLFILDEIPTRRAYSEEFDNEKEETTVERKRYIPPLDHPWRRSTYDKTRRKEDEK